MSPDGKPTTWAEIVGLPVPGWSDQSDRNRRAIRSRGSVAGYHVDWATGLVSRK